MKNVEAYGKITRRFIAFSNDLKEHLSLRRIGQNVSLFTIFFLAVSSVAGQIEDETPPDVAPPAIRKLAKDEKDKLESESKNVKKRTKLSIEMMDARILKAEKFYLETNYRESLEELAGFQAILDNLMDFLWNTNANDRRFIDFEIYLRKQIPKLETIRREMPYKYSYHVAKLMKSVRDARAKAVEPIFEDTVIPTAQKKALI